MEAVKKRRKLSSDRRRRNSFDNDPCLAEYSTKEARIKSFTNWPIPEIKTPQQLAKAGFYYQGYIDSVECVYCGGVLDNWKKDDDPFYQHAKYYPTCPFILKEKGGCYVEKVKQMMRNEYRTEELRLSSFTDSWPDTAQKTATELAEAGFFYTGFKDEVQCFHCGVTSGNWRVYDVAWFKHAKLRPTCKFVFDVKGPEFSLKASNVELSIRKEYSGTLLQMKQSTNQPIYKKYVSEDRRIASFKDWPIPDVKNPEHLAKIGFFYTGKGDYVKCFHCGCEHYAWLETEDPAEEHVRFCPYCVFIRHVKGDAFVEGVREKWRNAYRTEKLRKQSFKKWPSSSFKAPKDLIEAGFFYTETDDQTQCFECGINFLNWKMYDDPWFIHTKLNPSCRFVLQAKGQIFVNVVEQALNTRKKSMEKKRPNATVNSDDSFLNVTDCGVEDKIQKLMDSSAIQTVLNLGFDEPKIQQTLRDRLSNSEQFETIEELFAAVMDSQKQDPDVSAWLQNYEKENNLLKADKICGSCNQQGPILIFVPCGHLHSCCSCIRSLNQCIACKKDVEVKLEMFPE